MRRFALLLAAATTILGLTMIAEKNDDCNWYDQKARS